MQKSQGRDKSLDVGTVLGIHHEALTGLPQFSVVHAAGSSGDRDKRLKPGVSTHPGAQHAHRSLIC